MLGLLRRLLPLLFYLQASAGLLKSVSYKKEFPRSPFTQPTFATASQTINLISVPISLHHKVFGSHKLLGLGAGIAVPLRFGRQKFNLIIDTGSSDTWVISQDYQCADASNQTVPESNCNLGSGYQLPGTFNDISDENFFITYASTNFAFGNTGTDNIHIAGIKVRNQRVNIAKRVFFTGTPEVSGFLGLAYPSLTSAYAGTDPSHDTPAQQDEYDPLFTTMYKTNNIRPVFSIAIDRSPVGGAGGGRIAFGGLPPNISYNPPFVATPIIRRVVVKPGRPKAKYQLSEYTLRPDGYVYGPKSNSISSIRMSPRSGANSLRIVHNHYPTIIDTGTSLSFVPTAIADAVNALFDPPAIYSSSAQVYFTSCNASVPRFGVIIEGQTFLMEDDLDYLIPAGGGMCFTAISKDLRAFGSQRKINLLGIAWLVNVLTVFDVGNQQLRFAART